ncbi:related to Drebrin F [Sporisorium scitamineum]|uniref:Related to Drebrin F n=1 Tax=Sporisorium scitamineum TaxID=49012 RepID=A0A0F7SCJ7_9BASI|nr:related to Drebrin F [Sporisorium scitamineum]CDW98563.1 hypothetical protein [Sporisorium scitamineum]
MSLNVNLSSSAIRDAYEKVLDGAKDYLVLTYEKASNDLRVQVVENGDLDDLNEEFSDGRIQYAFARVKDPNTQLPKFALINWCGEGVPENRKGLFATHSSAVAQYLKAYHVSINARSEADVDPKLIMRRIAESSGANYSAAGKAANTHSGGPISSVGSSYKPIGTPDIKGMQKAAPKDTIAPVGTNYASKRDELQQIRSGATPTPQIPSAPRVNAPAFDSAPAPTPKPASTPSIPPTPRPEASSAPPKPAEDDRIQPVGTAYQPVSLGKPGKLNMANRFPFGQQESTSSASAPAPTPRVASGGTAGKLTWSQRQEAARKEREEEEARVKQLSSGMRTASFGTGGAGAGSAAVPKAPAAPATPATPAAPPAPAAPAAPAATAEAPEEETDEVPPPPPAPPAPPAAPAAGVEEATTQLESTHLADASGGGGGGSGGGLRGRVAWAYEAAEDNELTLVEGAIISNIEQIDEGWWSGVDEHGQEGLFPASYVELIEGDAEQQEQAPPAPPAPPAAPAAAAEPEEEDDVPPPPPPPPAPPAAPAAVAHEEEAPAPLPAPADSAGGASSRGLVCTAMYDFDASEDNELTFSEGDTIIHVDDQISDDWWSGTNKRTGAQGLFPANYVERA